MAYTTHNVFIDEDLNASKKSLKQIGISLIVGKVIGIFVFIDINDNYYIYLLSIVKKKITKATNLRWKLLS